MQFRDRKTTISLIRTVYDPAIKRGRPLLLGTLSKDAIEAPPELLAQLTDAEQRQLSHHFTFSVHVKKLAAEQIAAAGLPDTLRDVAAWYRRQSKSSNVAALAAECRKEWSEVLAAMSAAGVGRTRRRQATNKKTRQSGS